MPPMYKKILGLCIRVQPTLKDLQVALPEGEVPETKVAPQDSRRREEHDVTIRVYITRTGLDIGPFGGTADVEVAARLKVGGSTRKLQRSYRGGRYYDPPELLISHWNIVGNEFYYAIKLWECDTWPNADDTILNIQGQIKIPSGYQSGYKKITFGANGDLPVSHSGFVGYIEVTTKIKKPGQSGPGPGPGPSLPGPGPGGPTHPK